MNRPHRACGIGLLVATLVLGGVRSAHAAPDEDATSLVVQADAAHEAGRTAEAAELYTRAYRAMSPEERESLGEVVVEVAVADLKASWEATSDPTHAAAASALLEEYEGDMGGALPPALAEHREWIEAARASSDDSRSGTTDDDESAPAPIPSPQPDHGRDRAVGEREVVAPILIGVGSAALIAGAVLIGVGAPVGGNAEDARDDALADPRYLDASPAMRGTFVSQYDDYVSAEKRRGKGLVVGGAVLLGLGVGLAAYGIVRLVQARKRSARSARVRASLGGFAF